MQTGVKQGCVVAPTLCALFLAAMLNEMNGRAEIEESQFNIVWMVVYSIFADDCALVAHSADDVQEIVNSFVKAAISFGLQINIKKTECMFQLIPGTVNAVKDVFVNGEALKRVSSFSYLGSVLSDDCSVDKNIAAHLQKANRAYGTLQLRLWSQQGIRI